MAMMKDLTELLEERLAGAPIAGTLTSDELAAVAEGEADFTGGFFTVTEQRSTLQALTTNPLRSAPAPRVELDRRICATGRAGSGEHSIG